MKRVVRDNGKQLDNLDEMNKLLETQKLPKLTQEENRESRQAYNR